MVKWPNVTTASISWKQKSAIRWSGYLAASGRVILIHLEKVKRGERHIPSLWVVNGTYPSISSANFGTWEPSARPADGRTDGRIDDRYQDVRLLAHGGVAPQSVVARAWLEVCLTTLYWPKMFLRINCDETLIKVQNNILSTTSWQLTGTVNLKLYGR